MESYIEYLQESLSIEQSLNNLQDESFRSYNEAGIVKKMIDNILELIRNTIKFIQDKIMKVIDFMIKPFKNKSKKDASDIPDKGNEGEKIAANTPVVNLPVQIPLSSNWINTIVNNKLNKDYVSKMAHGVTDNKGRIDFQLTEVRKECERAVSSTKEVNTLAEVQSEKKNFDKNITVFKTHCIAIVTMLKALEKTFAKGAGTSIDMNRQMLNTRSMISYVTDVKVTILNACQKQYSMYNKAFAQFE